MASIDTNFIFVSCQQTEKALDVFNAKYGACGLPVVFSHPEFNHPKDAESKWNSVDGLRLEFPVFGLQVPNLLYSILSLPALQQVWAKYDLIPRMEVDTKIATFINKLTPLEQFLRENAENEAADRLRDFLIWYGSLQTDSIWTIEEWIENVSKYLLPGWQEPEGLEVNKLIPLLGVEVTKAGQLLTEFCEKEKKTPRNSSIRWLSKFASGFRLAGCATDFVNLLYAMYSGCEMKHVKECSESQLVEILRVIFIHLSFDDWNIFKARPVCLMLDCEDDDSWALVFAEATSNVCFGEKKVSVTFQLPNEPETFGGIATRFGVTGENLFYDPHSRNGDKLKLVHQDFISK